MVIFMISDWVWRVLNMILINTTIFCLSKTCVEKHFFHFILLESKLSRHFKWWRLMIIKTKQKVILEFIVKFWKSRSNPKKSLNKPNNRKLIYYIIWSYKTRQKACKIPVKISPKKFHLKGGYRNEFVFVKKKREWICGFKMINFKVNKFNYKNNSSWNLSKYMLI